MDAMLVLFAIVGGCNGDPPRTGDREQTDGGPVPPVEVTSVDPVIVDPIGGSRLTLLGSGFAETAEHAAASGVTLGGVAVASVEVVSDTELVVTSAPMEPGSGLDVVVTRSDAAATLAAAIDAWSPAELMGARLFDAASGLELQDEATLYEWQRLTDNIGDDWRVRDGNTTTWLPSTGQFFMVGGWNPGEEPDGFGINTTTTDEVWSSPDGVTWTRELEHHNGAFEPRHLHNAVVWRDELWMVGGDAWQGFYNHDVVSSVDGVNWTVELGPGAAADPPWSERALLTIGVYEDRLWMAGGQDLYGDFATYTFHNDVWVTDDGVSWTEVAADGPASDTRWAGCGSVDGLVEFHGEMWLVGCAQYDYLSGTTMSNEVWSTTDGLTWTRHAEPPWVGKLWPNVVVWDDKLWILFGATYGDPANGWSAGNANEAWYSEDGETWASLPPDAPVPGTHAQGVAVTDEFLLLAGGNYSFGFGTLDKSAWRLVPYRGEAVSAWTDRGADGLVVVAESEAARPVRVADAFGEDAPGLQFDGSRSFLALAEPAGDEQAEGRSVFWVARAPWLPSPWGWDDYYSPVATVVGGPVETGMPSSAVGYTEGELVLVNLADERGSLGEYVYQRFAAGSGLAEGPGEVRMVGITHATDGTVLGWADGVEIGQGSADYGTPRAWTSIGSGQQGTYYGPNTRFGGTMGAVLVLPDVADADTVERIYEWARGRFGVP